MSGHVNNTASLLRSGQTLTITSGGIINANTQGISQGIEGNSVNLLGNQIDNRKGAIRADQNLKITSDGNLNNNEGLISSAKGLQIVDPTASAKTLAITNSNGILIAGENLSVDGSQLGGDGKVLSKGDLGITLNTDFNNSGEVIANHDASILTTANLANSNKLQAGNALNVSAANIDNLASGEISAFITTVKADNAFSNRGLIDGSQTLVKASTLNNLGPGRIYGDQLALAANTINNDVEYGIAPVIAARDRLEIGAQTINNREHSLIFSSGDLAIGGELDNNRYAIGQATKLVNYGGTIEVLGGIKASISDLQNLNANLAIRQVDDSTIYKGFVKPDGSPTLYPQESCSGIGGGQDKNSCPGTGEFEDYTWLRTYATSSHTELLSTSPGKILSGENISITGSLTNQDSYIIAGGAISIIGGAARNIATKGQDITRYANGTAQSTWVESCGIFGKHCRRWSGTSNYNPASEYGTPYDLPTLQYTQYTKPMDTVVQIPGLGNANVNKSVTNIGNANADLHSGSIIEVVTTVAKPNTATGNPAGPATGTPADLTVGSVSDRPGTIANPGNVTGNPAGPATGTPADQTVGSVSDRPGTIANPGNVTGTPAGPATGTPANQTVGSVSDRPGTVSTPNALTANAVDPAKGFHVGQTADGVSQPGAVSSPGTATGNAANTVIRTIIPNTDIPNNALYRTNPSPDGYYLVETDPRFADYQNWLGSDYLLQALGINPNTTQKRLGDGFYEQRILREQIAQLTGRRFLAGYSSDEAEYRALMDNGATYAKAQNLRPGIALSAEQMAQLTSDIVWLVEKTVTLPDGTTQQALVPQVYVRVQPGDIDGSGSLLAGDSINFKLTGDLTNSGSIAGRTVVSLTADNINNLGGRISGNDTSVNAHTDLNNIGGRISGTQSLVATAEHNINVESTTHSSANAEGASNFSRTTIERVAGLYVSDPNGILLASAGNDVNLVAAQIVNSGVNGQTAITAGHDLNLGTVQTAVQNNAVWDDKNYHKQGDSQDNGTTIQTTGNLLLNADNNFNAKAANITSTQGAVNVSAGNDLNITAGESSSNFAEAYQIKSSGFFSSKTSTTVDMRNQTNSIGSLLSGNTVDLQSGHDIIIQGSNVASTLGTTLGAANDITLATSQNTRDETHFVDVQKSGLFSNGGLSITIGNRQQTNAQTGQTVTNTSSTVGSTEGNVSIQAGQQYTQSGSIVIAPKGNIDIVAKNVDIDAVLNSSINTTESKFKQSGLTVTLSSPVLDAVQSGMSMLQNPTPQTSDPRMQVLSAATTGIKAYNADNDFFGSSGNPDLSKAAAVNVSISIGGSKSQSNSTQSSSTAQGSMVAAGGNANISAIGAGQNSDLTVQGSSVTAGNNASLMAEGNVNLLAAQNTVEQHSANQSSSASVGIGFSLGGQSNGFTINASASQARGNADGSDVIRANTKINAGGTASLQSGADTNIKGAVVSGKQVIANVGTSGVGSA